MNMRIFVVAAFLGSALGACQSYEEPFSPDFGNSVRHNMSLHIINPAPNSAGAGAPDMAGTRATGAIERYDKGEVLAPEALRTSELGGN